MSIVYYYETAAQEDLDFGVDLVPKRHPAGGFRSKTQIGIHSLSRGQKVIVVDFVTAVVGSLSVYTVDVTVPGAILGDFTEAALNFNLNGLMTTSAVLSANTVRVTWFNPTSTEIEMIAGSLRVIAKPGR